MCANARILADSPDPALRDLTEALKMARTAVDLRPDFESGWSSLGRVAFRTGNLPEAIEALRKAISLPSGREFAYRESDMMVLAMAYWQSGAKQQARQWYDKAVERMEKSQARNEDFVRLCAEADALLGVTHHLVPASEKAENTTRPVKR